MSEPGPFETPLARDPTIALPSHGPAPRPVHGPLHKLQYVVELVGPRTVPSPMLKAVLRPEWLGPLGSPAIFVMSGADDAWRELSVNDQSAAYDSVALSWDLFSGKGNLSRASAEQLLRICESFAGQIQRRAMPMPMPEDVDRMVQHLQEVRETFDIGVNYSVVPNGGSFPEKEIWISAAALGLEYVRGFFQWKISGWEEAMLEVSPGGEYREFNLRQVTSGACHSVLGIGFALPCCPDPISGLEGCLRVGSVLATRLGGTLLDEDDRPVTERSAGEARKVVGNGVAALTGVGFAPGSSEAIRFFGCAP